jgi:hypothetical protein
MYHLLILLKDYKDHKIELIHLLLKTFKIKF